MSTPQTELAVRLAISGTCARITLARPSRRNALDDSAWRLFTDICRHVALNHELRSVVLVGDGEHFCAGADIHELAANIHDADWLRASQSHVAAALDEWAALPQPTIAMMRGSCIGGGAALAVGADFRIVSSIARFAVTPARLGLTYRLVDCLRLSQLVGSARVRELLMLAREIDGVTLERWGLATMLVDDSEISAAEVELLSQIAALSGYSQRGIKTTLLKIRDGATADDAQTQRIFGDAFNSPDFLAAAARFTAKSTRH